MKTSEAINELATAMAKAQGALKPAAKDSLNPHYQSKYADIASVWEVCREAFSPQGLAIFQDVANEERGISVVTRIIHSSGQWIEFGPLVVPVTKQDAHGVGSACSYGRRYSLGGATGVVSQEDDDGNAAVGHHQQIPATEHAHGEHVDRAGCSTTPPPRPQTQTTPEDPLTPPTMLRPLGLFGYGKKYVEVPWNLMSLSQLEWFRDADHTPGAIRDKCRSEIAWRAHESAKADRYRVPVDTVDTAFNDDIPM